MTYPLPSPALKEFLERLCPGEVRSGVVASIEQFGVLIDLDEAPERSVGFIPVPEVSWKWHSSCEEVVAVGQRVTAEVLGVDTEMRGQAILSLIALQPNPWLAWVDRVGTVLSGCVTEVVPFGVFVGIDVGMSGLVHDSELPRAGMQHGIRIGDEMSVRIAEVDATQRRVRLSFLSVSRRRKFHRRALPLLDAAEA